MRFSVAFAVLLLAAACATDQSAPAGVAAAPAPGKPVYLLSDILGASAGAVDRLLGAPALTRREGAGEYRRYGLKSCALIVILYPDASGAVKAAHVDAAALRSNEEKPDPEACLAAG
jgi:hypothetical protein